MARDTRVRSIEPTSKEIAQLAADLGLEKKGEEIVVLDLRKFSIGCEYFVIMSGASDPHVKALAEWVEDELARRLGAKPWHREGLQNARWVLLDYVDCVVHVFHGEARQYYMLERLWGDAPQKRYQDPTAGHPRDDTGETDGNGEVGT